VSTLNTALWYASRGTGVVALAMFTLVVLVGILTRGGRTLPGLSGWVTSSFHRNASLVAATFLIIHIATSIIDPYASIKIVDAFIPFVSSYRPLWLGLGAVAFDLMLAIIITSLLRNRMGSRSWRVIHWFTYVMWPLAVVHGFGTGSDASQPWFVAITAMCVFLVLLAVIWRIIVISEMSVAARAASVVAVLFAPMILAVWAVLGPLAPHWAIRAGTPLSALSSNLKTKATNSSPKPVVTKKPTTVVKVPSGTANVRGKVINVTQPNGVAIVLDGSMSNGMTGQYRIVLRGTPLPSGGVSLNSGTVYVAPTTGGLWQGKVVSLNGGNIDAMLSGPRRSVDAATTLTLDQAQKNFQGSVTFN
jgi:sulfoxide reductase heme-binding subunit YedZ